MEKKNVFFKILYVVLSLCAATHLTSSTVTAVAEAPSADFVGIRLFLTEKGFGYLEQVAKQLIINDLFKTNIFLF